MFVLFEFLFFALYHNLFQWFYNSTVGASIVQGSKIFLESVKIDIITRNRT